MTHFEIGKRDKWELLGDKLKGTKKEASRLPKTNIESATSDQD